MWTHSLDCRRVEDPTKYQIIAIIPSELWSLPWNALGFIGFSAGYFQKRWNKIGHLDGYSSINCSYADINLMRISDFLHFYIGPFHIGNATNIVCCPHFLSDIYIAYANKLRIYPIDSIGWMKIYNRTDTHKNWTLSIPDRLNSSDSDSHCVQAPTWEVHRLEFKIFFPPARDADKELKKERFHWRAFWESICLSFTVIATAVRKGLEEKKSDSNRCAKKVADWLRLRVEKRKCVGQAHWQRTYPRRCVSVWVQHLCWYGVLYARQSEYLCKPSQESNQKPNMNTVIWMLKQMNILPLSSMFSPYMALTCAHSGTHTHPHSHASPWMCVRIKNNGKRLQRTFSLDNFIFGVECFWFLIGFFHGTSTYIGANTWAHLAAFGWVRLGSRCSQFKLASSGGWVGALLLATPPNWYALSGMISS